MPRKPRVDAPLLLHHVCNRALARRPIFEAAPDMEHFQGCLQAAVEAGDVAVLAFTVLTTHFHLLVRSLDGGLSRALQRVEQRYVRYYNRTRDRDGPLFKDRFFSRPVTGETDFRLVVRYIDENPVVAGLVTKATDYPNGSAWWYARPCGPAWLSRETIEVEVCGGCGDEYRPERYLDCFGWTFTPGQRALIERRMKSRHRGGDTLDNLVLAAPDAVRRWLEERATVADHVPVTEVLLAPETVMREVALAASADEAQWCIRLTLKSRPAWPVVRAGLLRLACGLTHEEIGDCLHMTTAAARGLVRANRSAVQRDAIYADRVGGLLQRMLAKELASVVRRPSARIDQKLLRHPSDR
jgi:REP element-mobilizing transposase RayT